MADHRISAIATRVGDDQPICTTTIFDTPVPEWLPRPANGSMLTAFQEYLKISKDVVVTSASSIPCQFHPTQKFAWDVPTSVPLPESIINFWDRDFASISPEVQTYLKTSMPSVITLNQPYEWLIYCADPGPDGTAFQILCIQLQVDISVQWGISHTYTSTMGIGSWSGVHRKIAD